MRIAIIDDEPNLRDTTRQLLSIYCSEAEVVGEAAGVQSGIRLIRDLEPDLVLLDVEMGDGTGFDLIHAFPERQFAVVFVTAHDDYAVRAFKFSAIDYLLKPLDPDELVRAVQRARTMPTATMAGLQWQALETNRQVTRKQRLLLKDATHVYLIETDEIIRCESEDNYTRFHLTAERKILISTTLKEYETLLAPFHFFRCHQSHLINLQFFDHLDKREGGSVHLKDGSTVPVATRKRDLLLQALAQL